MVSLGDKHHIQMMLESIANEIIKSFPPALFEEKIKFSKKGTDIRGAILEHLKNKEILIVLKSVQDLVTNSHD